MAEVKYNDRTFQLELESKSESGVRMLNFPNLYCTGRNGHGNVIPFGYAPIKTAVALRLTSLHVP